MDHMRFLGVQALTLTIPRKAERLVFRTAKPLPKLVVSSMNAELFCKPSSFARYLRRQSIVMVPENVNLKTPVGNGWIAMSPFPDALAYFPLPPLAIHFTCSPG